MSTLYEDAYKEALALAPTDEVELATLVVSHPSKPEPIYLVQDRVNHTLTLEDSSTHEFRACAFNFAMPPTGENGAQSLTIGIDNIEREVSDFIDSVEDSKDKVTVTYRPYLKSDPTRPQMTPLVLTLSDVNVGDVQVTGKASFADIVNKKFLTEFYTRAGFPGLANS